MLYAHTRALLRTLGLPEGDLSALPDSPLRFPDGAHFRVEVPTMNSVVAAQALLDRSRELGVFINRVIETAGLFRHTEGEIKEYVALCRERGVDLLMSVGPRAPYDLAASVASPHGAFVGYRLRGGEQLVRAVEDVERGLELGVRGFVIYDEGLLWVLAELRRSGEIPAEVTLKVSAHCGHGNPASVKLLEHLGADSINPVRDLPLPALATLRATVAVPLDCHTDNPPSSGGFIRFYEAPEFVRVLAPVSLKVGNSVLGAHGERPGAPEAARMAEQVAIVLELLERHYPAAVQSAAAPAVVPLRRVEHV